MCMCMSMSMSMRMCMCMCIFFINARYMPYLCGTLRVRAPRVLAKESLNAVPITLRLKGPHGHELADSLKFDAQVQLQYMPYLDEDLERIICKT